MLAKGWEPPSRPVGVACGSSVGEVWTDPQPLINGGNNGVDYVMLVCVCACEGLCLEFMRRYSVCRDAEETGITGTLENRA